MMALHCDILVQRAATYCNLPSSCTALTKLQPVQKAKPRGVNFGADIGDAFYAGRKDLSLRSVRRCRTAGQGRAVVEETKGKLDVEEEQEEQEEQEGEVFVWRPPFVDLLTVVPEEERSGGEVLYRSWIASGFGNAAVKSSPPPVQKEGSQKDEFHLNAGYAIRTLREELPGLFYKELTYDIYREDIVFRDPLNTFCGIQNYKLIFGALRFHGRIFFKALWVDIVRVWQPCDNVITVRWTIRGVPRVPWEAQGRFDGTSEYKLDKQGKIYEHKVDNVLLNSPPKFHAQTVMDLVTVAGAHRNPTPTFYSDLGMFVVRLSPYLQRFTWVRYYWAMICTIAVIDKKDLCNEYSD